jgi:4-aminobutyrate aminotransferase / (S)-3-amino-2-methylpropionate transaminase / 5-aminovalerate transaminase
MTTNADLLARRQAAIPRGVATASPIFIDRAMNGEVWDVEGRRYIDFASGIAVTNTGHLHPKVVAAGFSTSASRSPTMARRKRDSLRALDHIFRADLSPDQVAAIVIEPVQGEGGFYVAPKIFIKALRDICDAHGICFVADEVQSGFARTGRFFAIEHYDVEPDLIPIAKALGGGLPISGLIGKAAHNGRARTGRAGRHIWRQSGGCAAALAVLDIIEAEGLRARAQAIGARLMERIESFRRSNDCLPIGDVRGLGAMVAFELVKERGTHLPDAEATKLLTGKALGEGLIILSCGYYDNTVRLLPPLTMPDEQLDEGLDMLHEALRLVRR